MPLNPILQAAKKEAEKDVEITQTNTIPTSPDSSDNSGQSAVSSVALDRDPDNSVAIRYVADAMEVVRTQAGKLAGSAQQARGQAVESVADVNAQTQIIVDATKELTEADKTIRLEEDLATQKVQRNTAAVFNAAGGQEELLEEAAKQYAASERIDDLQADIDAQKKEKFTGVGFIDDVINEMRTWDEELLIDKQEEKRSRAEQNISAIAKITQESAQANALATVTKTDAAIQAGQRQLDAASKIKVAQAELNATATNAEAMNQVLNADAKLLDAHMAGYKTVESALSLQMRSQELGVRIAEARERMAALPKRQELLDLQLKAARREDELETATLQGKVENAEIKLAANKEQLAQMRATNPSQAKLLQDKVAAAEINLNVLRGTFEKQILRDNAIADKAIFEYKLETETPQELAAQVNLGRAKAGLTTPESVGVIAAKLRNPNTNELYSQYMQAGGSPQAPLGNTAADTAEIKANAEASGASLPVTPASKAMTIINQRFATQVAELESSGQAPADEESAKLLYNTIARGVMEELNNTPIKDSELSHPFLLPPKKTLADSKAVVNTTLWQDMLSKMDVARFDTKLIQQSAVNLVRMKVLTPEQASREFNTIFQAGVDINAQLAGGWHRSNLLPQTRYILELPKAAGDFKSLVTGAGTIALAGLLDVGPGPDVPFLDIVASTMADNYRVDALDYTSVLNMINRDTAILGPIQQAEKAATAVGEAVGAGVQ